MKVNKQSNWLLGSSSVKSRYWYIGQTLPFYERLIADDFIRSFKASVKNAMPKCNFKIYFSAHILQCSYNTEYWFSSWFSEEKLFYITVVLLITCLSYLIPDERGLWRFVVRDKVWNPMPFTFRYRKLDSESNIQLLHPRLFVVWQSHSPFRALRFSFNLFIKIMYHILLPMIYFWKSNIGWEDIMITYI